MHRFYIPSAQWTVDRPPVLAGGEAHHCTEVLRLGTGDRVTLFNGRGAEATAQITAVGRDRVELKILQHGRSEPLACQVTLAQAIPKGKNMDLILQKAVELGAAEIIPVLSERTVVHLEGDDLARKQEKWAGIVVEAAKQCGQNWLPEVAAPVSPKALFEAGRRFDLMLIASLQPDSRRFRDVLAEFAAAMPSGTRRILVMVGPEGDFTPAELALAKGHGCRPVSLGPIVLRTETAALYCLSAISYALF